MAVIDRTPIRDRTRGLWTGILPAVGINASYLTGKNGPCPLCPEGGRDRWRFLNTDGNGTWICTHCGTGSGTDLVMRFRGVAFRDAAVMIEAVIGGTAPVEIKPRSDPGPGLRRLWASGQSIRTGDPVDLWLRSRGVGRDVYPHTLRAAHIAYTATGAVYPAMLAMVTGPDGKAVTIHRTYLTADGTRAPVDKCRMLYCAVGKGAAIRLTPVAPTMGVTEGIETALACARLFGVPTWSAISAGMLSEFEPPAEVTKLVVFADNDVNGVGQNAAENLGRRLLGRLDVDIQVPEVAGTDFNDVLLGR
jgi:putative DNA primase/helicase